jgi:hypothetical protein
VDGRAEAIEDAARILALLAEPDRLRVVAALLLGYSGIADISSVSGVDERTVAKAIARLVAGDLVVQEETGYRFATEEFKTVARRIAEEDPEEGVEAPAADARVLRSYMRSGRLVTIPAARSKRRIVLEYLAQEFEPGRRYPERKVNEILGNFNEDTAALRRYLVDEYFLTRERGYYWRSGGRFEVD